MKLKIRETMVAALMHRHGLSKEMLKEALEDFLDECVAFDEFDIWVVDHMDAYQTEG